MRLRLFGNEKPFHQALYQALNETSGISEIENSPPGHQPDNVQPGETWLYLAGYRGSREHEPVVADWQAVLEASKEHQPTHMILLSSAAAYPPKHGHPGVVDETRVPARGRDPVSDSWRCMEDTFRDGLKERPTQFTILRAAPVLIAGETDYLNRLFSKRTALAFWGYDPCLQFLRPEALFEALGYLVTMGGGGTFHLAPDRVIPLGEALRTAGIRRVELPYWCHWVARKLFAPMGMATPVSVLERIRYPWTIDDQRSRLALGLFDDTGSSAQAVAERAGVALKDDPEWDRFGLDKAYVDRKRAGLLKFLHNRYWRVEERNVEAIPAKGRAVLVGVHRGFMPFDGTMAIYAATKAVNRYPRFLIHPCLVKQPGLATFISKLGGVIADQDNADEILQQEGLLGIYPEGISGAFTFYKRAYRLGRFGRDEYVRIALRNRAPLIPFATVGSAEIFPIIGRINWSWFERMTEWPFFPIAPPWPLLPVPLPSKWHTVFLEPMNIQDEYGPEAAEEKTIVRSIGKEVERRLQAAIDDMLSRRKNIFFGNIFNEGHENGGLPVAD